MNRMKLGSQTTEIPLYHGSKGGIIGTIAPKSRAGCDFGRAFYMGTMPEQSFSICIEHNHPHFYDYALSLQGLEVAQLSHIPWMIFVGYNRDLLPQYAETTLIQSIPDFIAKTDVVVGDIADDSIYPAFENFTGGMMTDEGLIAALNAMQLGRQYALLTDNACKAVASKERFLTPMELQGLVEFNNERMEKSHSILREITKHYRRIGRTIDDLEESGIFNETFESLRVHSV